MSKLTPLARECLDAARLALIAARAELLRQNGSEELTEDQLQERTRLHVREILQLTKTIVTGETQDLSKVRKGLAEALGDAGTQSSPREDLILERMATVAAEIRNILRS